MNSKKAFTLVEIMMVVAIIALIAAIAIPNLIRAKISANDSTAVSTLKALSTASEMYSAVNRGNYPTDESSLTGATPPYINKPYCGTQYSGFTYTCFFPPGGYWFSAEPVSPGVSGTTSYTMTTGGILEP